MTHLTPAVIAALNPQARGLDEEIDSAYRALINLHRAAAAAADPERRTWHLARCDDLRALACPYQADGPDWLRIAILGICAIFLALLIAAAVL